MLWARKLQSELFWFAAAAAAAWLNGKIASDKNVERGCCVKKREENCLKTNYFSIDCY